MKKGWVIKPLGDVFETVTGNTPSKSNAEYYGRHIPLVKPPELQDCELSDAEDGLSEEGARIARVAPPSSILVSCIGNLGKIGFNTVPVAFNQQINAIIPDRSHAIPEFFFYQVLSCRFRDQLESLASGTTVSIVNKSRFNSIEIVLPPLSEQQRIVGILDEAFGGLATAQAHAAQNLQNARDLFESHLNAVFTQRGKGWVEKTLGDVAQLKNGLNYNRDSKGQTLPVVGVGDFQSNNLVPVDQLQTVTIDGELSKDYSLQYGDILTVRSNGSKDLVGRCMLVPELSETTSYSGFIIRIRVNDSEVFPPFLLHFMKSSDARDRLTRDGGGANISNINQAKLASLPLSLPPIAEQKKLVAQLDALSVETQRLTRIYEQKLAALAELKKSLLHQAFSGEL